MRKPTIGDIAREAGVGKATVSRVLNDSGYVGQDTRDRIMKVVERLQYEPSSAARSLSRRESDTIGIILPEVNNRFFGDILMTVSRRVDEMGCTLLLCSSENDPERDLKALHAMLSQRVRGLIYAPAVDYSREPWRTRQKALLDRLDCPVVQLDRVMTDRDYDSVVTDNRDGAELAARALIEAGHRRIGIIAGDMELSIGRERYEGFKAALDKAGLPLDPRDVIRGEFSEEITYEAVLPVLRAGDFADAYLLCNNLSERGFLRAAAEAGLRIPEDVAFISFDHLDGQGLFNAPYSHLNRHMADMGTQAVDVLLRRLEEPVRPAEQVVCKSDLILLGSERCMK